MDRAGFENSMTTSFSGENAVFKIDAIKKLAFPCLLVAWLASPTAAHAATESRPATTSCATSLSSLNGWYGLLVAGATTGTSSTPKYLVGALLFNAAGGITGTHVYSGAGVTNAATGGYVVNTDCTVSITLNVGSSAAQVYTVAVKQSNEAVGIETDASAVATIDLQPQYATVTTGLNFTNSSLNGTYAASCYGPAGGYSDLNLVTYSNGTLAGTDPYNNGGTHIVANNPYSGSYTVNSDGTFAGSLTVDGTPFDFNGVISNSGAKVQYIYSGVSNGTATAAFASCSGKLSAPITFTATTG